ncbi:hypothetical protein [Actinomadura verrucosospora]|uniref:Uncharacterized protein n=1 Tax=Actinomadura verrucosospora TaxID=46165 RepID=A0A7D4AM04_ACTVE|nr:hypothetical protein [Actinomadura verrucosospora]QKG20009.1 hypothetical protein ACTIVE_1645 [Actinomadura verrucosospora]
MALHENSGTDRSETNPASSTSLLGRVRDRVGEITFVAVVVALPALALAMCAVPGHAQNTCPFCSVQYCSLCDGHSSDGSCIK